MSIPHPNNIVGKWIINTHGKPGKIDNEHGRKSFGWADQNKVIVISGYCMPHFDPVVWNGIRDHAQEVADRLNVADMDKPKVLA